MQIINNKIVETIETDLTVFLKLKKQEIEVLERQIENFTKRRDAILAGLETMKSNPDVKEVLDILQDNGAKDIE